MDGMYPVMSAHGIAPAISRLRVMAPRVAEHWRPGQFVIVRPHVDSERIPLTIAEGDGAEGWIGIIVQEVGKTTHDLTRMKAGDAIQDVSGPLGRPTDTSHFGAVVTVGGGVGCAITYPVAAAMAAAGNEVVAIVGGRDARHVILTEELAAVGAEVRVATDDGSAGRHGLVTDVLASLIDEGRAVDRVFAAGPIPMMAAVASVTAPARIPTIVSLNPLMVDGTGMCGGCRVVVGGETRFACVDGPDFPAEQVDFALLASRNRAYEDFEERRRCAVSAPS